jgi:hypothetical protein
MNTQNRPKYMQTAFPSFGVPDGEVVWELKYRPRIASEQLRALWRLKAQSGKSIVQLVSEALEQYFETLEKGGEKR